MKCACGGDVEIKFENVFTCVGCFKKSVEYLVQHKNSTLEFVFRVNPSAFEEDHEV